MNMKKYTTLLFCLGPTLFASIGWTENMQHSDLEKRDLTTQETTEKATRSKINGQSGFNDAQVKTSQRPVYTPPFLGAPAANRLIGMAVRGVDRENLLLSVLTPEHTGLTSQAQPILYWYISRQVSESYQFIEFVLISEKSTTPVLRTRLDKTAKQGIQKISMADYNISLIPEVEYRWSIALVADENTRSLDVVSSGNVKLVGTDRALEARLHKSSIDQYPAHYAQAGLWYEAMTGLVNQVEKQPENLTHRQDLTALLEQAGLQEIVIHMNSTASGVNLVGGQ
jgi:hypothetical protein